MMKSPSKKLVLVGLLVLGAGLLVYGTLGFFPRHDSVSQESPQVPEPEHARDLVHELAGVDGEAVNRSSVARNANPSRRSASSIYADSKLDYLDRFHALMDLAYRGDRDAWYLAYRMRERCRLAITASKETILPELWSEDMGNALEVLKTGCRLLVEDPAYQDFSEQINGLTLGSFTGEIVLDIKKTFAGSGAKAAMSTALAAYRRRPDIGTATVVSDTLSSLDVLKYGMDARFNGSASVNPAVRKDLFMTALMLRGCDFGVPCGPGSDRMLRICGLGGGCQRGQDLYAYFAHTLSPENMRNVDSILDALRRRQLAGAE